jgi:hypothetical protein
MISQPKIKTIRDKKYMDWVKTLPCMICGRQSEPHHEGARGIGIKASDWDTIPLCNVHHRDRHQTGRLTFWNGQNPQEIIEKLNAKYRGI